MKNVIITMIATLNIICLHASAPTPVLGSSNSTGTLRTQRAALMAKISKPVTTAKQYAEKDEETENFQAHALEQITVTLSGDEITALAFEKESAQASTLQATMKTLLGRVAVQPLPATLKEDETQTYELNVFKRAALGYTTHPAYSFKRGECVLIPDATKAYIYGVVVANKEKQYIVQTGLNASTLIPPFAIGKKTKK